ncbi:MAG: type III pantothenate kinase [Ruminococcaceae bacterium]|nr:type III pantothenate kinase [Oscillospiraceae bacterium]
MILAIDCGNTHITVGCVSGAHEVFPVFRIPTDRRDTEFGYAAKIKQCLDLYKVDTSRLVGAAISCVVPSVTDILVRAVHLLLGCDPLVVGAGVRSGLRLCINDPGTVASDLVVAAVAAKEEYPMPCIIVDMGTATTVSALDKDARFIGCAILPGVDTSLSSLTDRTALLPNIEIKAPRSPIGTSTVDCMRAGIVYGSAGAVDGLLDRFAEALGEPPAAIIGTGGAAPAILPHCKHTVLLDEVLLLKGLRRIWDKNQK